MKLNRILREWIISTVTTSILIYGVIWTFADPIGFKHGWELFFILLASSFSISSIYTIIKALRSAYLRIRDLEKLLIEKQDEIMNAQRKMSYCCVIDQKTRFCPLGVTAINPHMESTIIPSIQEAQHSFRWLGLSAFNVIHNNKDIFSKKKTTEFEFVIANPKNDKLATEVDKYWGDARGTLGAKKLMTESNDLLSVFVKNVNPNIRIHYHNQMPTFRMILIDDKKAYVSFYEKGVDALKTVQLEITDNPDIPFSIFKWFPMFYQKFLITEQLITPRIR